MPIFVLVRAGVIPQNQPLIRTAWVRPVAEPVPGTTPLHLAHEEQKRLIETGRRAYQMLIPVSGNPNSKQPHRDLWDKGWRLERRKYDAHRVPRAPSRPPFKKPESNTGQSRPPKKFERYERRQPQSREVQPVLTEKLVDRFNRRHQTRA